MRGEMTQIENALKSAVVVSRNSVLLAFYHRCYAKRYIPTFSERGSADSRYEFSGLHKMLADQ